MPYKSTARGSPAARTDRDALAMLRTDHELIVGLFGRYAKVATREDGLRLLEQACRALEVHTQIEEELFYPAVRHEIAHREWLDEGEVEHRTIDVLVEELRSLPPAESRSRATASVLAQFLRQHLAREERRIFPQVRRAAVDLAGLGELLRRRREDIVEQRSLNGFRLPSSAFRLGKDGDTSARDPSPAGRRKAEGRRRRGRGSGRDYSGFAPF